MTAKARGAGVVSWGERICKETHDAKKQGRYSSAARVEVLISQAGKKSGVSGGWQVQAVRGYEEKSSGGFIEADCAGARLPSFGACGFLGIVTLQCEPCIAVDV